MNIKLKNLFIILFMSLLPIDSLAYNDVVHYPLTLDAILLSGIETYLERNLGVIDADIFTSDKFPTSSIPNWIGSYDATATGNFKKLMMEGALREDRPVYRTGNHFYDPTTGSKLTDGKNTMFTLDSALDRATGAGMWIDWKNALGQQTKPYRLSWVYARDYFKNALTLPSTAERDKNWGNLFLSLGNIVHLLQDMSVPSHVRNDSHGFKEEPDVYEPWCDTNPIATLGYVAVKLPKLTAYWDADINKGLSEFTNANFFSGDSNVDNVEHVPYYSKPVVLLEDQGVQEEIKNSSGKVIDTVNVRYGYGIVYDAYTNVTYPDVPLTAYSLWDFDAKKKKANERVYSLNDKINKTYADFLIPRAVGYSAGLLNYFFRGQISLVLDGDSTDQYVILDAGTEDMSGAFSLYYDDGQNNRIHLVTWGDADNPIVINANGQSSPVTFTAPSTPAPKEKDRYTLVFKGKMGNEESAVVGREVRSWREEWDNDLKGNHTWLYTGTDFTWGIPARYNGPNTVTNGRHIKENIQPSGTTWASINSTIIQDAYVNPAGGPIPYCLSTIFTSSSCLSYDFGTEFPLPITKNTWVRVKVDEMSTSLNSQDGGYQVISIKFDNGTSIHFTVPEQEPWSGGWMSYLTMGEESAFNIFDFFKDTDDVFQEPVAITQIDIEQMIGYLETPSTVENRQKMVVDYIRFEER